MKKSTLIAMVASTVAILDFLTKKIIVAKIMPHESINVLPFLRIVHVENKGAAFGVLASLGNNIFIIISFIAILFIVIYISRVKKRMELFSLSLILGGAAGNLIDRIRIGKVIDFIDIFIADWHWPSFNVADSALTVGIILFLVLNIRQGQEA